jgi:hypothetical protein
MNFSFNNNGKIPSHINFCLQNVDAKILLSRHENGEDEREKKVEEKYGKGSNVSKAHRKNIKSKRDERE